MNKTVCSPEDRQLIHVGANYKGIKLSYQLIFTNTID